MRLNLISEENEKIKVKNNNNKQTNKKITKKLKYRENIILNFHLCFFDHVFDFAPRTTEFSTNFMPPCSDASFLDELKDKTVSGKRSNQFIPSVHHEESIVFKRASIYKQHFEICSHQLILIFFLYVYFVFFLLAKRVERNCVIEMETNLINMLSYIVL